MKRIYLDHSATTPVDPEVFETMKPYFSEEFGNPSSVHTFGRETRNAIEAARARLANLIHTRESEIIFVSGGTEADNLAILGTAFANRDKGNHIITTQVEHPAVLNACRFLEKNGFEVTYAAVDKFGQIDPATIRKALRPTTVLISIIHANNEIGTLNPLREIGEIAAEAGVRFHTDAVQSFGKVPIDVNDLQLSMLSLSAHKIYGPKGSGALFIRKGVQISKLLHGGQHEKGYRAGTENLPGIIGLVKAAQIAHEGMEEERRNIGNMRDYLQQQILEKIDDILVNGHTEHRLYHNLNCAFPGCDGEALLMGLDMQGIAVSTGAACHSGSMEPSHVLKALGMPAKVANSTIRFTLGRRNTREQMDEVVAVLGKLVRQQRQINGYRSGSEKMILGS